MQPVRYLGMNIPGKIHGSPEMFSTFVMRSEAGYEAEGEKEYREANKRIQKAVKRAKKDWIDTQCEEIKT